MLGNTSVIGLIWWTVLLSPASFAFPLCRLKIHHMLNATGDAHFAVCVVIVKPGGTADNAWISIIHWSAALFVGPPKSDCNQQTVWYVGPVIIAATSICTNRSAKDYKWGQSQVASVGGPTASSILSFYKRLGHCGVAVTTTWRESHRHGETSCMEFWVTRHWSSASVSWSEIMETSCSGRWQWWNAKCAGGLKLTVK